MMTVQLDHEDVVTRLVEEVAWREVERGGRRGMNEWMNGWMNGCMNGKALMRLTVFKRFVLLGWINEWNDLSPIDLRWTTHQVRNCHSCYRRLRVRFSCRRKYVAGTFRIGRCRKWPVRRRGFSSSHLLRSLSLWRTDVSLEWGKRIVSYKKGNGNDFQHFIRRYARDIDQRERI